MVEGPGEIQILLELSLERDSDPMTHGISAILGYSQNQTKKALSQITKQDKSQRAIRTMFCLSSTFLLLLSAYATTFTIHSVEARDVTSYKTKGVGAGAYVNLGGEDACFYESLSIDGSSSALKEKASGEKPSTTYSKVTFASYSWYNWCTGQDAYGYAEVYPSTFTGSKDGATASATISSLFTCSYTEADGYSCDESPFELTIDATWTATGNFIKDRYTSSYGSKLFATKYTYSGTSREITTVTLQVTKDGQELSVDPSAVVYAYLYTSMTGYVDRYEYY